MSTRRHGGLAYEVFGSGEPVLLLHPAFVHRGAFAGEVESLGDRLRMISVDLPGHGETGRGKDVPTMDRVADALVGILDAEGVQQAHVLGVSMGSLLGQDLARRHPDRVRTLTALGGYEVSDAVAGKAQGGALLSLLPRLIFARRAFQRGLAKDMAVTDAGRARMAQLAEGFRLADFLAMRGMDKVLDLERTDVLRCPLLIVVGEHDLPVVREASARWHAAVDSRLVVLEGAGHCANLDDAEGFHRVWTEHLGV
jgi:3-oxoadipate enol-lactonase